LADWGSGKTLRVLLVSTEERVRDEVTDALASGSGSHEVFWVSQPGLASARAQDLLPHVILVDDALTGANVIPLIRELSARAPGASIVALVRGEDIAQARQAVLAGARGFVTKPLAPEELAATLQQTLGKRPTVPPEEEVSTSTRGGIIVFCAPKGGTGRTTLAINAALSLRMLTDEPVALVDADYAAPAIDVALNLHSNRDITDLLARLSRLDEDLVSGVLTEHATGVQILLAPPPLDMVEPITLPQVQHILVILKRMFPWVVVDLGLPLDELAYGFLDSADRIVVTVLPEMVGLRNTRLMLDRLNSRGYADGRVWLVVNRSTMQGGVSQSDIQERLRMHVIDRIPDDQPLATLSINRGVPLVISHRRSAVGRAVRKLARLLVEDLTPKVEAGARNGGIGRWFSNSRNGAD
jgi:pilus assembly protein CpaE